MNITRDFMPLNDLNKKKVRYICDKPMMSSDGGLLLLRALSDSSSLIPSVLHSMIDTRHQSYIDHSYHEILSQRVGQILSGYVDANDRDIFKSDPMLKMFSGKDPLDSDLCSQSTMSRLENSVTVRTFTVRRGWSTLSKL